MNEHISQINIHGEDGIIKTYDILSRYFVGKREYIALKRSEDADAMIELYRCADGGGDNIEISNIISDMELSEAKSGFEINYQFQESLVTEEPKELDNIITVPDNAGNPHDCEIIQFFDYAGVKYIALLPLEAGEDGGLSIQLFSCAVSSTGAGEQGIEESIELIDIPEAVYGEVREYFLSQFEQD